MLDRRRAGFSTMELLVVLCILSLLGGLSFSAFRNMRNRASLAAAVQDVRDALADARSRARTSGANTGVKFRKAGARWDYTIYRDGDFDGVRNDDIASGIDPIVAPSRKLLRGFGSASIGFPQSGVSDPDLGYVLGDPASPIRFNNSTICSFAPDGGATPGSIFLTDPGDGAAVVRVFGPTGRIRVMLFNRGSKKWIVP